MKTKTDLVNQAINTVLNPTNDYGDLIKDAVTQYLTKWTCDELRDLLFEGKD